MSEDNLIINPQEEDNRETQAVLDELRTIMAKRGYCLVHRADAMLLVKVQSEALMVGRAVAYVKQINPKLFEWKPIDWAGDFTEEDHVSEDNLSIEETSLYEGLCGSLDAAADDFNESEARWVAAFLRWEANERCLEFGI